MAKINFSQFKEGEFVKCHHNDSNPVIWFYGTFHKDKDFGRDRYYVQDKCSKYYFYDKENKYGYEIQKISKAEKILLGFEK